MIKITRVPPEPAEPLYTIEGLTRQQCEVIRELLFRLGGTYSSEVRMQDLALALGNLGIKVPSIEHKFVVHGDNIMFNKNSIEFTNS